MIDFIWGVVVGILLEMFLSAGDRSKQVHYSKLSNPRTIRTGAATQRAMAGPEIPHNKAGVPIIEDGIGQ